MGIQHVAIIFDDQVRPDTTGIYCRRALESLVQVVHFRPDDLSRVPRAGFDLYLNIDDGLEYRLPERLRPSAWWAIDTHLNLEWCIERARDFDFVFAAQRDGAESLRQAGVETALWLPLACDPQMHKKHKVKKEHDVCFVGHIFPGPRADLLGLIQRRFKKTFVGERFFEEMARTYSASRMVFNRSIRNDINMRVFEALACGSLLVTNDLADNGQDELFRDGVHLATYGDGEELADKIRFYLKHARLRERIAAAGRAEVLKKDTYKNRMEKLLAEVEKPLGRTKVRAREDEDSAEGSDTEVESADAINGGERPLVPSKLPAASSEEANVGALLSLIPKSARRILLLGRSVAPISSILKERQGADIVAPNLEAQDCTSALNESLDALDFAGQGFDLVVLADVVEYVRDPLLLLRTLRGGLQPGGQVIASVSNRRHHGTVRALLEGHWFDGGALKFFTRREIEKLCFRAGLAIRELRAAPGGGHDQWRRRGCPGEVKIGGLHIGGLPADEAEEFYASGYFVCAEPAEEVQHGLTSIVMVTYNQLAYTRRCLDSVRQYTDEPFELICVDNGSTDGSLAYLRSQPGASVISNTDNRGFPAAVNQGIQAARGDQILLLNNDCIVTTGWLRRLLAALIRDPQIGLVGPCSNYVSGEQQIAVGYDDDLVGLDGFAWDWAKAHDGKLADTDRLVGFCLMLRRKMLDHVGAFDEQFGIGCFEDDDFCRRATDAGWRAVIARDAFVHHFGGRSFLGAGIDFAALMRRNEELYQRKWQRTPVVRARAIVGPADLRVLVIAHVGVLQSRMDRTHYYRYRALARKPGVTLFGPGIEGYRPGMSLGEAVETAFGGEWPDVILHGADLKESGVPLVTGMQEARALTAIEVLDSWARPDRQIEFINRQRFDLGLLAVGHHLAFYRQHCPNTEFFWAPNAVDTSLFKNYGQRKKWDVVLYGNVDKEVYPLRARLLRLLADQSKIRFRHIADPGYYPARVAKEAGVIVGADLSREINKAWIGIATCGIYQCVVVKYLEIAASHALVAGNMPDEGRAIFENNFIELSMDLSDKEILARLQDHLGDKDRLRSMTAAAHRRVVDEYSNDAFAEKLQKLFHQKLRERAEAPVDEAVDEAAIVEQSGPPADQHASEAPRFSIRRAPGGGLLLERSQPLISLCVIARDNARTIKACLESARRWVDEMIVVDTGSTDETPRSARELGARVYHFKWCDDFSAARNESIKYARGKWIFWMDTDDTIDETNGRKLRALAERQADASLLGYVMQVHCPGPGPDGQNDVTVVDHVKLFRNLHRLRFDGRIHEQIIPAINQAKGELLFTDVYVTHSGYDHSPDGQKRKLERDLRILYRELEERPDHTFTLFNLGMTYADVGRYDEAAGFLWRSIEHSGSKDSHLRKAYALLVHCESLGGDPETAYETCCKALRLFPKDAELRFRKGVVLHQLGRLREAVKAYHDLLGSAEERHFSSVDRGITGFKARQNLALVYMDLCDFQKAEAEWQRVVDEKPRYRSGWRGLGDTLIKEGKREKALALAGRLLRDPLLRAEARMLRGQVFVVSGDLQSARREFEQAAADDGIGLDALNALCQFLFEHIDPAEAQAPLEELVRRDPANGAAYQNLGTAYQRLGRHDEAVRAYRQSLGLRPDWAPTYVHLGYALRGSGQIEAAIQAWQKALHLAPGDPDATEALRAARATCAI
jgi:GT2 family glycosyltransferase/spore maturation protein CgeB/Flp pilus assembly protein TadD